MLFLRVCSGQHEHRDIASLPPAAKGGLREMSFVLHIVPMRRAAPLANPPIGCSGELFGVSDFILPPRLWSLSRPNRDSA